VIFTTIGLYFVIYSLIWFILRKMTPHTKTQMLNNLNRTLTLFWRWPSKPYYFSLHKISFNCAQVEILWFQQLVRRPSSVSVSVRYIKGFMLLWEQWVTINFLWSCSFRKVLFCVFSVIHYFFFKNMIVAWNQNVRMSVRESVIIFYKRLFLRNYQVWIFSHEALLKLSK
jgi:hypothetical protein